MFELLKTEGKARRGVFTCAHGTVQTPVFIPKQIRMEVLWCTTLAE